MTIASPVHWIPRALNHLLAQEPRAQEMLLPHAGKVACFDAAVLMLSLEVNLDGTLALAPHGALPQVTIKMNMADIPLALQNRVRAFSYVRVEGDADFANTISRLSQSLKWDAEEDLSKWIGDIAAVKLVSGTKTIARHAVTVPQKLAEQVADYLLEENPVLARAQSVKDFARDVVTLRDDVERLMKRIERLEERMRCS